MTEPKIPDPLSTAEVEKIFKESAKRMKEAEEKRYAAPEPRKGTCKVCGGVVTEEYEQHTDVDVNLIPFGPTGRSYYYWRSTGLGCVDCGIMYKHLGKKTDGTG